MKTWLQWIYKKLIYTRRTTQVTGHSSSCRMKKSSYFSEVIQSPFKVDRSTEIGVLVFEPLIWKIPILPTFHCFITVSFSKLSLVISVFSTVVKSNLKASKLICLTLNKHCYNLNMKHHHSGWSSQFRLDQANLNAPLIMLVEDFPWCTDAVLLLSSPSCIFCFVVLNLLFFFLLFPVSFHLLTADICPSLAANLQATVQPTSPQPLHLCHMSCNQCHICGYCALACHQVQITADRNKILRLSNMLKEWDRLKSVAFSCSHEKWEIVSLDAFPPPPPQSWTVMTGTVCSCFCLIRNFTVIVRDHKRVGELDLVLLTSPSD